MRKFRWNDGNPRRAGEHAGVLAMASRIFIISAAVLPSCVGQQTTDATAWLQFIGAELRQLRVELLEESVAKETDRIRQIGRDLEAVRHELNKQQTDELSQKQQLAALEKEDLTSVADPQAQAQVQTARRELAASTEVTRGTYGSLAARETELNQQAQAATARLHALVTRLKQLTSQSDK